MHSGRSIWSRNSVRYESARHSSEALGGARSVVVKTVAFPVMMEENLMFRRTIASALTLMFCAALARGEGALRFRNGPLELARKSSTGVAEDLAAIASVRS